jgi:hypothetical protein
LCTKSGAFRCPQVSQELTKGIACYVWSHRALLYFASGTLLLTWLSMVRARCPWESIVLRRTRVQRSQTRMALDGNITGDKPSDGSPRNIFSWLLLLAYAMTILP